MAFKSLLKPLIYTELLFYAGFILASFPLDASANALARASANTSANELTNLLGGPESVSTSRYQIKLGTRGMVVSDDPLASEWGAEILRRGGNAIDAAVATSFALA